MMSGWKTWAAGLGGILGGLALILKAVASGDWSLEDLTTGWAMVSGGLAAIGIGHKVEKLKQ